MAVAKITLLARDVRALLGSTLRAWNEDKATRLSAAIAYYTVFSLAPLLVIAIALAGTLLGADAARGYIYSELRQLMGGPGALAVQAMVSSANKDPHGVMAAALGFGLLIFGASGVFYHLQDALNTVWNVTPKPARGYLTIIRERFFSMAMVLGTGFLLLVSLLMNALLAAILETLTRWWAPLGMLLPVSQFAFNFLTATIVFALIFKILPDVRLRWRDVRIGAVVTAVLFALGQLALGYYLGKSAFASAYGAAGSLAIVMLWVFYSTQILLFGAEFTRAYTERHGSHISIVRDAAPSTEVGRDTRGMRRQTGTAGQEIEGRASLQNPRSPSR